ncbi:MAG: monofunctional biosynthetic peptidoglycan transglycosylase [Acidobacteria bacterium]|nr:monofunctional biosynthetic peptidoglycan transglycosylase [Acidobacteriota bacterium]MCG2812047.1 monofunctional biosynthetic peptidoglycan transglycosylase [Candidatus Aminicenantes bacterium]
MNDKKKNWRVFWRIAAAALALALAASLVFWLTLPSVSWLKKENPKETAMMKFRAEQARQQGKKARRYWKRVPLSRISPYLIQAVLIAEDDKFFEHEGFDWVSMRQALETNIAKKRVRRGGSTITQQLAKNLFLKPSQNIVRKLREAAIAVKLERELSKKRILELYLNLIEWGDNIYGAEAAARSWFSCPAAALTLSQAIRLASILPNPHRFSALDTASTRLNRKRRILAARMLRRRWIQQETYDQALAEMGL